MPCFDGYFYYAIILLLMVGFVALGLISVEFWMKVLLVHWQIWHVKRCSNRLGFSDVF